MLYVFWFLEGRCQTPFFFSRYMYWSPPIFPFVLRRAPFRGKRFLSRIFFIFMAWTSDLRLRKEQSHPIHHILWWSKCHVSVPNHAGLYFYWKMYIFLVAFINNSRQIYIFVYTYIICKKMHILYILGQTNIINFKSILYFTYCHFQTYVLGDVGIAHRPRAAFPFLYSLYVTPMCFVSKS